MPRGGTSEVAERVQPTAAEWEAAGKKLESPFGRVEMQIDGYSVTLQVKSIAVRKFAIVVYVNGWWRGEWMTKDCEERRRFMRPSVRRLYPKAVAEKHKKGRDAHIRAMKRLGEEPFVPFIDFDKAITTYSMYWESFNALKRHLLANNKDVAFVTETP